MGVEKGIPSIHQNREVATALEGDDDHYIPYNSLQELFTNRTCSCHERRKNGNITDEVSEMRKTVVECSTSTPMMHVQRIEKIHKG